jgi:hypothetical protein
MVFALESESASDKILALSASLQRLRGIMSLIFVDAAALLSMLDSNKKGTSAHCGTGGLRGKARTVPPNTSGFWQNQSFHNYADYIISRWPPGSPRFRYVRGSSYISLKLH